MTTCSAPKRGLARKLGPFWVSQVIPTCAYNHQSLIFLLWGYCMVAKSPYILWQETDDTITPPEEIQGVAAAELLSNRAMLISAQCLHVSVRSPPPRSFLPVLFILSLSFSPRHTHRFSAHLEPKIPYPSNTTFSPGLALEMRFFILCTEYSPHDPDLSSLVLFIS